MKAENQFSVYSIDELVRYFLDEKDSDDSASQAKRLFLAAPQKYDKTVFSALRCDGRLE